MLQASILLLLAASTTLAVVVLNPISFMKIPARDGSYGIGLGSADRASYDIAERIVYVIGSRQDTLHVVDVLDDNNPKILVTHLFDLTQDGIPIDVSVCRSGSVGRFAISFSNRAATQPGHIQIFEALTRTNLVVKPFAEVTVDPDPKSIVWDSVCGRIVMASEGLPGNLGGQFVDPTGAIDIIIISPAGSTSRIKVDFANSDLTKVRQVYRDNNDPNYSIVQDIEPENCAVTVDNEIFVTLEENNAIARLSLDNPDTPQIYWQGVKNWNVDDIDTSDVDQAVTLKPRNVRSFYQSSDIDAFQFNNRTYLLTADTGAIKTFTASVHGRDFNEATLAKSIPDNYLNMDALTRSHFKNASEMGNLQVSNLHQVSDGWNPTFSGFDNLVAYGGRGWSIWRASDMQHMYESGSDLEYYAHQSPFANVFNADVTDTNLPPPATFDTRSDNKGPEPTVIAHARFNDKSVVVVGSGRTGMLYVYTLLTIAGEPSPQFESIARVGLTNDVWQRLYDNGQSGTPIIKDMVVVDHGDRIDILVVGSQMGVIQIYAITEI